MIDEDHARYHAPSQFDLGDVTTPPHPDGLYGTQPLRWTDSLVVGHGNHYVPTAEDVGKAIHCAVSVDNGGATVWKTAGAPEIIE